MGRVAGRGQLEFRDQTKWRIHFLVFSGSSILLFGLWYTSSERTALGFLAISIPLLVLVYAAAVAGATAHRLRTGSTDQQGSPAYAFGPSRATALAIAGCAWLEFVGGAFSWSGDWQLGLFSASIGFVFLVAALPGRLSMLKVGVVFAGLVVASIMFMVRV